MPISYTIIFCGKKRDANKSYPKDSNVEDREKEIEIEREKGIGIQKILRCKHESALMDGIRMEKEKGRRRDGITARKLDIESLSLYNHQWIL